MSVNNYQVPNDPLFDEVIGAVAIAQKTFLKYKEEQLDLWPIVQKKLKIRWTTDSNAIEGSTLTFAETLFFLEEGLTVEGKPLKDFLDARNHSDAIEYLMEVIKDERPITTSLMKEINALLLHGVKSTPAQNSEGKRVQKPATPGEYKKQPNHVLQPDQSLHKYVEPIQVANEMEELINWIDSQEKVLNPIVVASIAHYNFVRIHPFDDGNGRGARILMNLILMKARLLPAIIRIEQRRDYLSSLRLADAGELAPFITFIVRSMTETLSSTTKDFKQAKHES